MTLTDREKAAAVAVVTALVIGGAYTAVLTRSGGGAAVVVPAGAEPIKDGNLFTWPNATKNDVRATFGHKDRIDLNLSFSKWAGEVKLTISPVLDDTTLTAAKQTGEKAIITGTTADIQVYALHEGEGIEYEIILKEPPRSNIFTFALQIKGLTAYYQDELWKEFRLPHSDNKTMYACNATYCWHGGGAAERPENVVGSYAIYGLKAGDYSSLGRMNYMTGKFLHIYRPMLIDAQGETSWASMNISPDGKTLTITADAAWLNDKQRKYPVIVDPTFGKTDIGGSQDYWDNANHAVASKYTSDAVSGMVGEWLALYTSETSGISIKGAIWKTDETLLTNAVGAANSTNGDGFYWNASIFSTKPDIAASTSYFLGYVQSGTRPYYKYDSGASGDGVHDPNNDYTTPKNFVSPSYSYNQLISVYVMYSTGGAAPVAGFSCSPTVMYRGCVTACTNTDTESPTEYRWYSPNYRPMSNHTTSSAWLNFTAGGYWDICHIATNAYGTDTECKHKYLFVMGGPI